MDPVRWTAVLRWRDGRTVTVGPDEGWRCDDESLQEMLNLGWSTRDRVQRRRGALALIVREVAKVFSADQVEFCDPIVKSEVFR